MPLNRKQKLLRLRTMLDLETGELKEAAFQDQHALCAKAKRKTRLDSMIRACRKCPGLNIKCVTEACPGWGNLNARIFFIGQSLHDLGVETSIPFILGSGFLIDAALVLAGITRYDIFLTNVVHCHPLGNRSSRESEKHNCLPYLREELKIVKPDLVVTLGNDARQGLDKILLTLADASPFKTLHLKHPAAFYRSGNPEARVAWVLRLAKAMDKYSEAHK